MSGEKSEDKIQFQNSKKVAFQVDTDRIPGLKHGDFVLVHTGGWEEFSPFTEGLWVVLDKHEPDPKWKGKAMLRIVWPLFDGRMKISSRQAQNETYETETARWEFIGKVMWAMEKMDPRAGNICSEKINRAY